MGAFEVDFEIADVQGSRWTTVRALVDTGSTYTWIPRAILAEIGIEPTFQREFETADGRVITRDMGSTLARFDGQTLPTLIVFSDGHASLVGVVTLEEFGLGVDPMNQRLVRVRGLAMPAAPLP